jgi:hypothetical protein
MTMGDNGARPQKGSDSDAIPLGETQNDSKMENGPDPIVWVRRQWNSWKSAAYRLSQIEGLRWDDVSGGAMAKAPRRFLHGYVWCNQMIEGELEEMWRHWESNSDC